MTTTRTTPRPVTPLAILAASLDDVVARLDEAGAGPDGVALDPALGSEIRRAAALAAGLDPYTAALSTPESPALRALSERTAAEDWAGDGSGLEQEMLSGHLEGQLLKMLVHVTRARQVLEIGMFTGYSALAMAEAVQEVAGEEGVVVACEIDERVAALAQECFEASPAGDRIDVHVGPAMDTLHALADAGARFDLVFLDADKAGYADYLRALLDTGLLARRGLLVVDNTLMQGQPWTGEATPNGEAIAAFNQVLADDPRVEQVVLPVRDGVTLVRRTAG
ncbi:SAM-dependent methyltransferase [Marmoricola sp. Leaf446]|uniref:O-methyltransferase n=1 Tax=Marmoricola sp. Leaf446 TaxID=1736379 RepID=UPI0006FC9A03|nr:class I SAM-dependent methyltransferase [Marmoricola sp. Leaf446]KQT90816.1 SAM-dependent methyltransferase [Marmoricola sp. Leaf446]